MPTSSPTRRTFTISFPPELAEQVEEMARRESRTTSELFREAFRAYRAEQFRKMIAEMNEMGRQNNHNGYTADDVERLIHEDRAERGRRGEHPRK
ncbi:MAG TPA: ribbon-helix-helix protein, CopG family [Terracidiphilus sp.]|jgi:metal-responsive CopG/Arc/MetJ family transcriptional regulator|nr:ribbon-helix-helix protein, CopG family [Terracidiphilus sp.]